MEAGGAIQILSTVAVIIILYTIQFLYKKRFMENIEANENKVNIFGLFIFIACIALAIIWMRKF